MNIKLYLPYYPMADVEKQGQEISDEEYVKMLNDYYNSEYNNFIEDSVMGMLDERHGMSNYIPKKYQIEAKNIKVNPEYYEFNGVLNNMEDKFLNEQDFINLSRVDEMSAFFIHLNIDDKINPDSASELSLWINDSKELLRDAKINDNAKFQMLPAKNLIISYDKENHGIVNEIKFELISSRVIDLDNKYNFAILVNKILKK